MKQRRLIILGALGVIVLGFAFMSLILSVGNNSSQYTAYNGTSSAIRSTNSAVFARLTAAPQDAARDDFSSPRQNNVSNVQGQTTAQQPIQNRIVLKNATMSVTVADPATTITAISKMAAELSGWVVTSSTYQQANASGTKQTYGNVTIRVPADKLDSALDQIKAASVSVDSLNVTGEDVTEQYTDLNSQLTNLQTAEDDLRKIMDSASKTEDVLSVYKQLTDIRGQIDVIKGKLKFYDESAAYSSIAVTLSPSADSAPLQIGGWQPGNTLKSAFEALVRLVQGLLDVLIWLVVVGLPFVILLFVAYRIYRRFWPRTIAPSTTIPPAATDETDS